MTLTQYKESIRKYRGHLKSCDSELNEIWKSGSGKLIGFSLVSKLMGVGKMANVANGMTHEDQDKFVSWLLEKKRNKTSIDVKLLELI